ncbi:ATP-dependent helicase, partial [Desulfocurvibacter africanus]|uniref:ATP-dependent helicase n=1 Tax=Desulfocurvibacter africanus TaxID=873 RepID=UPI002FDA81CC
FRQLAEPVRRVLDRLGIPASVPETEAFWREPRVALILAEACRFLGMASPGPNQLLPEEQDEQTGKIPELPEKILFQGPLALSAYLQESGPFDRFFWKSKAFRELSKQWERNGGWIGLVNWVHLQSDLEMVRGRAESVQIMTLHAAKGLEFEAVFLPCLEDGILPFAGSDFLAGKATQGGQSGTNGMDEAEERRLFYVGLTRARRMLHLSHSGRRDLYGKELRLPVSRFLAHLPDELLCKSRLVASTVSQAEQLSLL